MKNKDENIKNFIILLLLILLVFAGCEKQSMQNEQNGPTEPANSLESGDEEEQGNQEQGSQEQEQLGQEQSEQETIVLYQGFTLNNDDFNMDNEDDRYSDYLKKKYNREYDYYKNGEFVEHGKGEIEGRGLDAYWYMPWGLSTSEIAFAGNYDPYPRAYTICTNDEIGNLLINDIKTRFQVDVSVMKVLSIDLDGDEKTEYIAHAQNDTGYSQYYCLFNQDGGIISYLLACSDDAFAQKYGYTGGLEYDLEDDTEIIDVNGDGCMEMIVTMPSYEGFVFNVYRYDEGEFTGGEFINVATIRP